MPSSAVVPSPIGNDEQLNTAVQQFVARCRRIQQVVHAEHIRRTAGSCGVPGGLNAISTQLTLLGSVLETALRADGLPALSVPAAPSETPGGNAARFVDETLGSLLEQLTTDAEGLREAARQVGCEKTATALKVEALESRLRWAKEAFDRWKCGEAMPVND